MKHFDRLKRLQLEKQSKQLAKSLPSNVHHFDVKQFQEYRNDFKGGVLGSNFIYHANPVTSTMDCVPSDAPHGTLVFAEAQTKGRGRKKGRKWLSSPMKNIYCTLKYDSNTTLKYMTDFFKLNLATSIALCEALHHVGVTSAGIKWPNDIIIETSEAKKYFKLAGMLITIEQKSNAPKKVSHLQNSYVHIGIGINVNQHFDTFFKPSSTNSDVSLEENSDTSDIIGHNLQDWTVKPISCVDVTQKEVSRERLLAFLVSKLESLMKESWETVVDEYLKHDRVIGRDLYIFPNDFEDVSSVKRGTAIGISKKTGGLKIRFDNGVVKDIMTGEVSLRYAS